ncbi:hypothetical protein [Streptomyces sp. NPDC051546]|uniref:hypothetical protein n=1 Tax=Streptomyces sp. NPDC051546 TaxID=3365655 RepID=UPI0037A02387
MMTWTVFKALTFDWAAWTLFEALWIGMWWASRSRVLGRAVYWIPGAKRVRRRACASRVDTLLLTLEQQGVPAGDRPDRGQLVERWHRIVAGRCTAVIFQVVPVLIVVVPFLPPRPGSEGPTVASLWMFAGLGGYGAVSVALMAADERAAAVSDAAGLATTRAALFLEVLLVPGGRRPQGSALDAHAKAFRRLCRALRIQARHTTRELPVNVRERVRLDTEQLIAALAQWDERYLLASGEERGRAARELAHLVSDTLRHSCVPRDRRDSLVVVSAHLLAGDSSSAAAVTMPEVLLWKRLLRGVGWLALAGLLFTGAVVLPGGGIAVDMMVIMGMVSVASVFPPLREVLGRALAGLSSVSPIGGETENRPSPDQAPQYLTPSAPVHCPSCSDLPPGAARPRPVG